MPPKISKNLERKQEYAQHSAGKVIFSIVGIIFIILFVWITTQYIQAKQELKKLSETVKEQVVPQDETQILLSNIRRHALLPNEIPIIETISNVESLKQQDAFYKDAKDGQKILTYTDKTVIYDPIQDLIINMGVFTKEETKNNIQEMQDSIITLDIRNGSKVIGMAQTLSTNLDEKKYDVLQVVNAANRAYKENIIINLKDRKIDELITQLKAKVVDVLPENEKESEADVVIILGNEK